MNELRCDSRFITTWQTRFAGERLAGLYGRHPSRAPRRDLVRLEARVLDYTLRRKPADGSTHWSSRKLAVQLDWPFMTVQRVWRKHTTFVPHRLDTHMVSNARARADRTATALRLCRDTRRPAASRVDSVRAISGRMGPVFYLGAAGRSFRTHESARCDHLHGPRRDRITCGVGAWHLSVLRGQRHWRGMGACRNVRGGKRGRKIGAKWARAICRPAITRASFSRLR